MKKKKSIRSIPHRPRLELRFLIRGPHGATVNERRRAIRIKIRTGKFPKGWKISKESWIGWRNPNTKHGRTKYWQYSTLENTMPSLGRIFTKLFRRC